MSDNKTFTNLHKESVFKKTNKPGRKARAGAVATKRLVITVTDEEKNAITSKRGAIPESAFLYQYLKDLGLF